MKEGDVILTPLPQADGKVKPRPAIALRKMPPLGDFLICGVSAQVHLLAPNLDELITSNDDDFSGSGLLADSLIRLGFLAVIPRKHIIPSCAQRGNFEFVILNGAKRSEESRFFAARRMTILLV
ncbi:MAG: transcriptional regulator [Deltaproteobacteria bacterium]|nr:transcriptional regulator [Deltaproteobacteria bacterium]